MQALTDFQEQWLTALESGNYKQGSGKLHKTTDKVVDRFCCLGVACDIFKDGMRQGLSTVAQATVSCVVYDDDIAVAPSYVVDKLNLYDNEGNNMQEGYSLVELNDDLQLTFAEIATRIRENPANYFVNKV